MIDGVGQLFAAGAGYALYFEATVEILPREVIQGLKRDAAILNVSCFGGCRHRVFGQNVLVELHPQVGQHIGREVGVGDGFGARNGLFLIIELHPDVVVGALLPIVLAGRPGGGAVGVGSGQQRFKLGKLVGAVVGHLSQQAARQSQQQGAAGEDKARK